MPHINIEIKARTTNQKNIREILKSSGADFKGIDHQIDTYFKVASGRLKLREGNIENHLIYYDREDTTDPKISRIILYENTPRSNLKEILIASLSVLVVVDKQREMYFIENVKFHLDNVSGLGAFVEIEAIDTDGSIGNKKLLEQCNYYRNLLNILKDDLVENSYSDLMMR